MNAVGRRRDKALLRRLAGWPKTLAAIVLGGCFGIASASSPGDDSADVVGSEAFDARGEQVTAQVCANACHSWDIVFGGPRMLPSQWDFVVSDMQGRGAVASKEQLDVIKPWLKWIWGAVWINSASPQDLVAVLGLTQEEAEAVMTYRKEQGKFADLESLKAVPGIDSAKIDARAAAIVFN